MPSPTIVVTGASGYIGAHVLAALQARAIPTVAWSRGAPRGGDSARWRPYDLAGPLPDLGDAQVVIHLAADITLGLDREVELAAARTLLAAARRSNARVLFVSSQVALAPHSEYGRRKQAIEALVAAEGGLIVRPGLVYGATPAGLFATLCAVSRRTVLIPAIWPAPVVQPIHVDDLAEGVVNLALDRTASGAFNLAGPPMAFHDFLRDLRWARHRGLAVLAPAPRVLLRMVLLAAPAKIRERINSLLGAPSTPYADDLASAGIALRPLRLGLMRSPTPGRRQNLAEGRALLKYVAGFTPSAALVRRYARAVQALRAGRPLMLPPSALAFPGLLVLLERPARRGHSELEERLDWAISLAEATPAGEAAFAGRPHFVPAVIALGLAACAEVGRRLLAPPLGLVLGYKQSR
ncbi:MAG: NAD(P)-dependent oxidoreductase [Phenylobacterium sp.]